MVLYVFRVVTKTLSLDQSFQTAKHGQHQRDDWIRPREAQSIGRNHYFKIEFISSKTNRFA